MLSDHGQLSDESDTETVSPPQHRLPSVTSEGTLPPADASVIDNNVRQETRSRRFAVVLQKNTGPPSSASSLTRASVSGISAPNGANIASSNGPVKGRVSRSKPSESRVFAFNRRGTRVVIISLCRTLLRHFLNYLRRHH